MPTFCFLACLDVGCLSRVMSEKTTLTDFSINISKLCCQLLNLFLRPCGKCNGKCLDEVFNLHLAVRILPHQGVKVLLHQLSRSSHHANHNFASGKSHLLRDKAGKFCQVIKIPGLDPLPCLCVTHVAARVLFLAGNCWQPDSTVQPRLICWPGENIQTILWPKCAGWSALAAGDRKECVADVHRSVHSISHHWPHENSSKQFICPPHVVLSHAPSNAQVLPIRLAQMFCMQLLKDMEENSAGVTCVTSVDRTRVWYTVRSWSLVPLSVLNRIRTQCLLVALLVISFTWAVQLRSLERVTLSS